MHSIYDLHENEIEAARILRREAVSNFFWGIAAAIVFGILAILFLYGTPDDPVEETYAAPIVAEV